MRRQGLTDERIAAALIAVNAQQCDPPLPDVEVSRIAKSVARYPEGGGHAQANDGWPDVIPFENLPVDDITAECLPDWLGDMVHAVALSTETPPALAVLMGLGIVSACVAGKADVSPEPGYSEPLNLFTCAAMESGNRKTAVLKALLGPVIEWEREAAEHIAPARDRAISDRRTYDARIDKLRRKAASSPDPSTLMREIHELEAKLPIIPALPRLHVDDCTPERLASLMAEQGGRMAVFSDEGGIFDVLAGRYSKGTPNLDLWLKGHAVSPVRIDRADVTRPPISIDRPYLTVSLSPQPDVLKALRNNPAFRGRGLLARFLFGLPTSYLGYRKLLPSPVPSGIEGHYRAGVRRLIDLAPSDLQLRLSDEAYREWKEFQRAIEFEFREGGKLHSLTDWGSKLAGAAARIAGISHMVQQVGRNEIDDEIASTTMKSALGLAASLISHARSVFALMERDPNVENAKKLIAWMIRKAQPQFTIRDCFRAHQEQFKRVDAMMAVLLLLAQHGYIRRVAQDSTGGRRPSDLCLVNPTVLGEIERCA
jgi:hypothetical protein